jgi:hypothetical protein
VITSKRNYSRPTGSTASSAGLLVFLKLRPLRIVVLGFVLSGCGGGGSSDAMAELLNLQTDAIERILESGVLPLSHEALNSTDHPAWARLRNLANDPG